MAIEELIGEAVQELKRMRVEDGPSDENRKAQWYLNQALAELNPNKPEIEPGPDVPSVAEEETVGEEAPSGEDPSEEGSAPPAESSATEGAESGKAEETAPTEGVGAPGPGNVATGAFGGSGN